MSRIRIHREHDPRVLRLGEPFTDSIERLTERNNYFRHVLYTPKYMQLVLMSLAPGEEIGREVHKRTDQFFRIEKGRAIFLFDHGRGSRQTRFEARPGDAVVVPAGTFHNVVNRSRTRPMKLYTIYAPPHHPPGTVHRTKADAEHAERSERRRRR